MVEGIFEKNEAVEPEVMEEIARGQFVEALEPHADALVAGAILLNVNRMFIGLEDFKVGNKHYGDWVIEVRRINDNECI